MVHQFKVRFHAPLRKALLFDPKAQAAAPVAPSQTLWQTDIGREMQADRQAITTALTRMADTLRALDSRDQQRLAEWQRTAIELGITIATRLLHDKIQAGEMAIESVVKEAVARLGSGRPLTVRLHPDDLSLLQKRLEGRPLFPDDAHVELVGDSGLGRGDCRAEGPDGSVLSQLAVQLAEMRQRLLGSLGHAQSEA